MKAFLMFDIVEIVNKDFNTDSEYVFYQILIINT